MSIQEINAALAPLLARPGEVRGCVAFSGGLDSSVLLHALAQARAEHPQFALRALHVNHHLLPEAEEWAEHCRRFAAERALALEVIDVQVPRAGGESTEAAAREARYTALAGRLGDGELLSTAHHQDDQLETVLLQLLRGAGVAGLAAMPQEAPLGRGRHVRPFLHLPRAALRAYAEAVGLTWIEDTSNVDLKYDRNFLRHRVLPLLYQRWPAAAATVARSARHLAEARSLLDALAQADLATAGTSDGGLRLAALGALPRPRARNLLRYWIRSAGARAPSAVKIEEILRQMLQSRPDAAPRVAWPDAEIYRHRGAVYLATTDRKPPAQGD